MVSKKHLLTLIAFKVAGNQTMVVDKFTKALELPQLLTLQKLHSFSLTISQEVKTINQNLCFRSLLVIVFAKVQKDCLLFMEDERWMFV